MFEVPSTLKGGVAGYCGCRFMFVDFVEAALDDGHVLVANEGFRRVAAIPEVLVDLWRGLTHGIESFDKGLEDGALAFERIPVVAGLFGLSVCEQFSAA